VRPSLIVGGKRIDAITAIKPVKTASGRFVSELDLRFARDRVGDLRAVGDTGLEVAGTRRNALHDAGGLDQRALERRLVADQLVGGAARLRQRGVERGQHSVSPLRVRAEGDGAAVDELLERRARLRVERVQQLVEVDRP